MAYMNQEKKAKIAAELKLVVPKSWKYSIGVHHHSTIMFTLKSAPVDVLAFLKGKEGVSVMKDSWQVNEYSLDHQFEGEVLETMKKIAAALNLNNHDRSDAMTDYFDVGHYVSMNIGRWDKPFVVKK